MADEGTSAEMRSEIELRARQLVEEALDEAAGRARGILVERLTDALVTGAERILGREQESHPEAEQAAGSREQLPSIPRQSGSVELPARAPEQVASPEQTGSRDQPGVPTQVAGAPEPAAGCYLFAIAPARGTPLASLDGMNGSGPVREITAGGVAAIACEVPLGLFDGLDQEPVGPDSRLVALARRHDEVVRATFERRTVLPLRFGTVLASERQLVDVLEEEQAQLLAELGRLEGKAEWTCRIQPDPEAVAAAGRPAPERVGGAAYLAQREQQLAAAEQEDPHGVGGTAEQVNRAVDPLVESSGPPDVAGEETRISYLVPDEAQERFARAVVAVAEASPTVRVELLGPHPPYHFATVQLGREGR